MVEANELRRRGKPSPTRDGAVAGAEKDDAATGAPSVERAFADQPVPSWREQLTVRTFVVSFFLAVLFSFIVMKLNLTVGIIPSLNISADRREAEAANTRSTDGAPDETPLRAIAHYLLMRLEHGDGAG